MRSYAVVGLGAVGGLYGGRLAAAGHDVHFVVRSSADEIRRKGLRVASVDGDIRLDEVSVFDGPAAVPPVDVVVVALKTTANHRLAELLPPLVGDATTVVVLQNGLGVEARAAAAVPGTTVLGGLCFVCSHRGAPGRIEHLDYGRVTLAEHRDDGAAAGITDVVSALAADFDGAGIDVVGHPDLVEARWKKLVWNVPYNGLSVVLDAGTDELMADADTRRLVTDLMREVLAGAAACGRDIEPGFVDDMLTTTDAMTPYSPSMKLDFDAGLPLELEAIYAAPLDAAAAAGVDLPTIAALHRQLRFMDRRGQDGR